MLFLKYYIIRNCSLISTMLFLIFYNTYLSNNIVKFYLYNLQRSFSLIVKSFKKCSYLRKLKDTSKIWLFEIIIKNNVQLVSFDSK
ncbi:hypothetical protein C1646_679825 [Rhizophagus diaphanus]|nr:hypothetical protein C1646_679825 [Rhizophagus diaphanus] [Rhizophagus sp. MUCL 43196]